MNKKKLLALLMALVMTFSLIPTTVWAGTVDDTTTPAETKPALPEALITTYEGDALASAASLLGINVTAMPISLSYEMWGGNLGTAALTTVWDFQPKDMPSEASASYYADWNCDFTVSFDKPVAANSVGLYGAYAKLRFGFLLDNNIQANTPYYLLKTAGIGDSFNYDTIVSEVQEFLCSAFSLSHENDDTKITVNLVLYKGEEVEVVNSVTVSLSELFTLFTVDNVGYEHHSTGLHEGAMTVNGESFVSTTTPGPHFAPKDAVTYVAQIGETKYETLAAAINAAVSNDTIEILDGTWGADAIGTRVDAEWYNTTNGNRFKSLTIEPAEGATVTFTSNVILGYDDSSTTNAKIIVRNIAFESAVLSIGSYVDVTVEGCTFTGAPNESAGTLVIRDTCCENHKTNDTYPDSSVIVRNCIINGSSAGAPGIRLRNTGDVTLDKNTIENTKHNGILIEENDDADSTARKDITITNNTIKEWNADNNEEGGRAIRLVAAAAASGSVNINDNYFIKATTGLDTPDFVKIAGKAAGVTVDLDHNFWNGMALEEVDRNGSVYTVDKDATVVHSVIAPVAQIVENGQKYPTLDAAIDAANEDDTVKLLDDITYDENRSVTLWEKAVNLDLDCHTLTTNSGVGKDLSNLGYTASAICYAVEKGAVTISNGRIETAYGAGVYAASDSNAFVVTLKDLTIIAGKTGPQTTPEYTSAVRITGGAKVIIESGSYTSSANALAVSNSGGEFEIKDGTFDGQIFFSKSTNKDKTKSITIEGGKFKGEFVNPNKGTLTISGGYFTADPSAYVADGYEAVTKGNTFDAITYNYVVGKITTSPLTAQAGASDYSATYAATKKVVDEDGKELATASTPISVTVTATQEESDTKATAKISNITDEALQDVVGNAADKAGDANVEIANVEITVAKSPVTETTDKVTYEVHPEAIISVNNAQVGKVELTNEQIDGTFTFNLNVNAISTTVGNLVKVTHVSEGNEDEVKYYTVEEDTDSNKYITITTDHFSSWTVEDATSAAVASYFKGGTTYKTDSLAEAFAQADDDSEITLLQDVTLTDRLFVNAGANPAYAGSNNRYATTSENKSITLNMNGHNIDTASNIALAGGSLNIVNTSNPVAGGKISTSNPDLAPVEIRGTGNLTSGRTLTIGQNVTLEGSQYGLNVFGSNDAQKNVIDVTVNGTVKGTLFVLGNLKNTQNEIDIKVNGTVTSGNDEVGIALNGYAKVTVNDGANVSGKSGIEVRAGKLIVNGGNITGTGAYQDPTPNGSGTTSSGAAVAVAQHSTELPISVTLTGGNLYATGDGGKLIVVADPENKGNIASSDSEKTVQVVATASFKNNSAVEDGYEWVADGGNYTLRETPIEKLGGSLRKRATDAGRGVVVHNETDLRFGFKVKNYNADNGYSYSFTYKVGENSDSIGPLDAYNIDTDGTINLVLTKVPAAYYSSEITATLHVKTSGNVEIATASQELSVKDVAYGLKTGNYADTWKNYASEIYDLATQQQ